MPGQETGASLLVGELSPIVAQMKMSGTFVPNFLEAHVRHKVADANFAVLRTAVAARHRLLSEGAFPKSPAEFGPLLPGGPLGDCFATSAPLRFLQKPDGFHVYSVGPDGQDSRAAILYDPTNGSVSRGDLALRIPFAREYPFPAGGVRVNTAAALLKMFPNGLPPDPFADKRWRPLSIIAASEEDWKSCALPGVKLASAAAAGAGDGATSRTNVVIFSFGPDTDESQYMRFRRLTGEDVFTTYSVYSARLQIVLPPNAASVVPPPPAPAPGLAQGPLGVGRARVAAGAINSQYPPGGPFGNPAASSLLEPYYDPTNGTTSNGNLYLEIPPPETPAR